MRRLLKNFWTTCGREARRRWRTPVVEQFEQRSLLATFTVTSLGDNDGINPAPLAGTGTLRQAIIDANASAGEDVVEFAVTGTINIVTNPLPRTAQVHIKGPGAGALTLNGANLGGPIFERFFGTATISGLRFSYDNATTDSVLELHYNNFANLTVTNCIFENIVGTAIENVGGVLTVEGSHFINNTSQFGVVFNSLVPATTTVIDSTFSNNTGSAVFIYSGTVNVSGSTFTSNTGVDFSGARTETIPGDVTYSADYSTKVGSGIYNLFGTATVTDSDFINNDGSGIFNRSLGTSTAAGLTVSNSRFNSEIGALRNFGGGIANLGTLEVRDSEFRGNVGGTLHLVATVPSGTDNTTEAGSGIFNYDGGVATVSGSTFDGNLGSGIFNFFAFATVANSTFTNNHDRGGGGGISSLDQGTLKVHNSTFVHNSAPAGGAINVYPRGTLEVSNSTFVGNLAGYNQDGTRDGITSPGYGGAISATLRNTTAVVTNSIFSENRAYSFGGGIFIFRATLTSRNNIFSDNAVEVSSGGGIFSSGAGALVNVGNTILVGNHAPGSGRNYSGTVTSAGNNLVGNTSGSSGFTASSDVVGVNDDPIDLHLGPLQNNGGPTQTMALLPGSPAIDAGDNSFLPADLLDLDGDGNTTEPLSTDQRGLPYTRVNGVRVDIGAFENHDLVIGGTAGDDNISVAPGSLAGTVKLTVNGVITDNVSVVGEIRVTGSDGIDTFVVTAALAGGISLDGGGGSDVYDVSFGSLAGFVRIADSGGAGTDRATIRGTPGDDEIVKDLSKVTFGNPVDETVFTGGLELRQIRGGGGDDLITDPGSDTEIYGDEGNDTIILADITGLLIADGGEGSDTYIIRAFNLQGPITINDTGTVGTDAVTIEGTAADDTITQTGNQFVANGAVIVLANVERLTVDGGGGDGDSYTVIGPPTIPTTIAGVADMIVVGTEANDRIHFIPGGSPGEVIARLNGVVVASFSPTGRIVADGRAGDDEIHVASGVAQSAWLYGDRGNDRLNAGNGGSLLIGGDGNDQLQGGGGRDVMVGGQGSDSLVGNSNDDILISGFTTHDARSGLAHEVFWRAVLLEWLSVTADSPTRAGRLRNGSGSTGVNLLAAVVDDLSADQFDFLNGGSGEDWLIFTAGEDRVVGQVEVAN